jgi:solute carrier family 25 protein 38
MTFFILVTQSLIFPPARNVPGVALYMTSLTQLRTVMATSSYFESSLRRPGKANSSSVLPTLTNQGNLIAGATARVGVGFLLNPFSVLKARFEVRRLRLSRLSRDKCVIVQSSMYSYQSLAGAFTSMARLGPSELLRGFFASSLRDAPYAGIFVVFYEGFKRETSAIPRCSITLFLMY